MRNVYFAATGRLENGSFAMAKRGTKFTFHGAYGTKAKAVRKEKRVGGFIRRTRIKGNIRYLVLTRKGK